MTSFVGLSGLTSTARLFPPAFVPADTPDATVRYELTLHGWSLSHSNLDHPRACAVTDCQCQTLPLRFGRHKSVWLEGAGHWLSLDAPEGFLRFVACRTHNLLPLWDVEHSSRSVWATFLGWSYCATADEPPTSLIAPPKIVVTLHDDIDHGDAEADDLAYWLLSTEWRPRRMTVEPEAAEDGDTPSFGDQREAHDLPDEVVGCHEVTPPGAIDSGYSSPAETAEPTASDLRDREINQKLADMISAVDWGDDE